MKTGWSPDVGHYGILCPPVRIKPGVVATDIESERRRDICGVEKRVKRFSWMCGFGRCEGIRVNDVTPRITPSRPDAYCPKDRVEG